MFLGIDLGTQSLKVIIVNTLGEILDSAQAAYPIQRPQPAWAEQNPDDWWESLKSALQNLPAHHRQNVQAIGLAGQMHGLVLLDENQKLLRPAIIWMDQRSADYHTETRSLTGNELTSGLAGASLMWLKDHEPETHNRIETVLFPKDWLRLRMTGALATELSDASGGLFLEVGKEAWAGDILPHYGITPAQLPHLMRSVALVGVLLPQVAKELGLPAEIPIGAGAADQAAMLVGSGVLEAGQAALTLGTGGQLSLVTQNPQALPNLNLFCHAKKQHWYYLAALLAGGYTLTWWSGLLGQSLSQILPPAKAIPPGAEGLRFSPHLNGSRQNAAHRAHFVGLTARHTQAHLTRAILEGVAFAFRESLASLPQKPRELVFGGGGSQESLWQEILASVLNIPLVLRQSSESTALGAAMLAAVGIGAYPDLDTVACDWVKTKALIEPRAEWAAQYAQMESLQFGEV